MSNIIFLTTTFLFPFLGILVGLDVVMTVEGMVMYLLYYFIFFAFYILGRKVKFNDNIGTPENTRGFYVYLVLWFCLGVNILFVLYSVANYGIQGAFINSREVYTTTRTGSGQIYYVASIFLNLYAILGLFVYKRKILHFLFCVLLALPYGTKGKIFLILIYNLAYVFFVNKDREKYRRLKYFLPIVIFIPLIMVGAFWYTSIGLDQSALLQFVIGYGNEYENNFHDMIIHFDHYFPHGYLNGTILFGDVFYPFIPRVLWPGKPLIFGDLYLSYIIYPEATIANAGAPSFGPLGQPYADFGFWGGLVQIFIEQSILGFLLGRAETKCIKYPSIFNFFLLIALSFGGLIGLAATNRLVLLAFNVTLIFIIFYPLKYKFVLNKKLRQ
ncbi:O-antigen polymerase [Mucilaginibacter pallidiroseus]|nr:O-antigen polymerase [Mucilaginibacter pallidiroseus]